MIAVSVSVIYCSTAIESICGLPCLGSIHCSIATQCMHYDHSSSYSCPCALSGSSLSSVLCRLSSFVEFRMQEEIELKFTKYHKKGARYVRCWGAVQHLSLRFQSQLQKLAQFRHPFQWRRPCCCCCCCLCQTVKVSNYTSGGNSVDAASACCHSHDIAVVLRHFHFVIGHPSGKATSISVKFLSTAVCGFWRMIPVRERNPHVTLALTASILGAAADALSCVAVVQPLNDYKVATSATVAQNHSISVRAHSLLPAAWWLMPDGCPLRQQQRVHVCAS